MSSPEPDGIPIDGDLIGPQPRPPHLRPLLVLLVAAGGAVGTAAREGLVLAIPEVGGLPVAVLGINVGGAFLLGLLLEALARGSDEGARLRLRMLLGTGFCGGFTTYSALATTTAVLLARGDVGLAALYALGTLLLGAAATWAGIACGALRRTRA